MARILRIDRDQPLSEAIAEAARVLRSGGIVAYLTDTLYGLGVVPFDAAAVARVFAAKGRMAEKALPLIIGNKSLLTLVAREIPAAAQPLMDGFWPGPLSLVMHVSPAIPAALHGNTGTIAVRWPACTVACALAMAAGGTLTATSANRSGAATARNAEEVAASLGDAIELVVDSGPATTEQPSTVVDATVSPPRVLRPGAISTEDIEARLKNLTS